MNIIRFRIEGLVNSFRVPQTAVYQNTTITPTKTQIVGLLTNIMGKVEKDYYELLNELMVGIVPVKINNIFVDLWQYKKWKESNQGRAVLTREKIFLPIYDIYIGIDNDMGLVDSLKHPRRIPALAMDDELIMIKDVKELGKYKDVQVNKNKVNSIFIQKDDMHYFFRVYEHYRDLLIIPPRVQSINLTYNNLYIPRKSEKIVSIVEFVGGYCDLTKEIECIHDKERDSFIELF